MSDRAVHLSVIPNGTILFEVSLGDDWEGTLVKESQALPREEPGIIKLHKPVTKVGDSKEINEIELWPRCMPENMICKTGDILKFNVKHYRPDNLVFARDVVLQSYRKLGREIGVICPLKDQKFGFVTCLARGIDAYFRLGEVINYETGSYMKENEIFADMTVSFDVSLEEVGRAGVPRFKATRVRREEKQVEIQRVMRKGRSDEKNHKPSIVSSVIVKDSSNVLLLKTGLKGTIMKEPRKEQTGVVELNFDNSGVTKEEIDASLYVSEAVVHDPRLVEAIQQFVDNHAITELKLDYQTSSQRRGLHLLLTDLFPGIAHETIEVSDPPKSGPLVSLRSVKIWKVPSLAEFNDWVNNNTFIAKCRQDLVPKSIAMSITQENSEDASSSNKECVGNDNMRIKVKSTLDWDPRGTLPFTSNDYNTEFGPAMKDLNVTLDVYFDRLTFKRIAKNICMTDEAIDDVDESSLDPSMYDGEIGFVIPREVNSSSSSMGILEVVKGGTFGFIRKLADDEKLFWNQSSLLGFYPSKDNEKIETTDLQEGRPVLFTSRRRGGLRCAVNIQLLAFGALRGYSTLKQRVQAVAIGEGNFILTDVSSCPLLNKKVANVRAAIEVAQQAKEGNEAEDTSTKRDIRYFSSLHSTSLTVKDDPSDAKELPVGTLVTCQAVVDWAYQRFPLSLTNIEVDTSAPPPVPSQALDGATTTSDTGESMEVSTGRRKGIISKLKVDMKKFDFNIAEISEIRGKAMSVMEALEATNLNSNNNDSSESLSTCEPSNVWYCDTREFGRNVQQGDEVDFVPVPGSSLAVDVKVKPSSLGPQDVVFKRTVVNAALKSKALAKITMAEGPPTEQAVGFVFPEDRKWVEDISTLPWAHLLSQQES